MRSAHFRLTCLVFVLALSAACQDRPAGLTEDVLRHNIVGTAYLSQQKWSDAEAELRKAVELNDREPTLLVNLAVALMQQARPDEAEPLLNKALELDPNNLHAHYLSALIERNRGEIAKAAEHFDAVVAGDPRDVSAVYNLAASLAQTGEHERAERLYRKAIELNPTHISSIYGLGRLLLQTGQQAEGTELINRSRELREGDAFATTMGEQYGEQGPYAMAVDFPGGGLTAPAEFAVSFVLNRSFPSASTQHSVAVVPNPTGADIFHFGASEGMHSLLRAGSETPLDEFLEPASLLVGDVDADGSVELLVGHQARVGSSGTILGLNANALEREGGFVLDRSKATPLLTLVDRDHDGDLDLFGCWPDICFLANNDGEGNFGDRYELPLEAAGQRLQLGFSDVDNDRDIDLLVLDANGLHALTNLRNGTFADTSDAVGLTGTSGSAFAVADYDKDGWMDLLVLENDELVVLANQRGRFAQASRVPLPESTDAVPQRPSLAVFDVDNDGLLDVIANSGDELVLVRNMGASEIRWQVLADGFSGHVGATPLMAADIDADGDLDLIAQDAGSIVIGTNEGGNSRGWISVSPRGVRDNLTGVGAKVELLSGALRQKFEVTGPQPLHIGLGDRERVDAVRLLWPGGVLQDELDLASNQRHEIEQLDRKGTSCPLLYAWRDGQWQFVTDFLGGSAIGYRHGNGNFSTPDTDEYVLIENGLAEMDGTLRLRMNNQLEEVIWFDKAELIVVDHPQGTQVFPNERLMPGPPFPGFALYASNDVRPVRAATSVETGADVAGALARRDRHYVDDFALEPHKGYAEMHTLEIDLGPVDPVQRVALLLDGWIDYADSTSNLSASQAGLSLTPPRLHVADGRGGWSDVSTRMGFPAGLPKTMLVDLSGLIDPRAPRVRIATNMRIYWDRARVMRGGEDTPLNVTRHAPAKAELRFGGFPAAISPDGKKPRAYDPQNVSLVSPWKTHMGIYTAFGDVTQRLATVDDTFVTTRNGDEIELRFAAPPAAPEGWTRTFLLYADGFGKDMDPNSAASSTLAPIPFHAMGTYPRDTPSGLERAETDGRFIGPARDGLDGAVPLALRVEQGPVSGN